MEAKDSQNATIDANKKKDWLFAGYSNWLKAGCAYQMIASQEWKEVININRKNIINASPEIRAMILAASIIHNPNSAEICRMIIVANENKQVDNFEYYSKVLWLLCAQTSNPVIKARIILALGIAPLEHVKLLYEQELGYYYSNDFHKKNIISFREACDFSKICFEIIVKGAKESLLKNGYPLITEVVDNFFAPPQKELVLT